VTKSKLYKSKDGKQILQGIKTIKE
jgi:hypothetical protein